MARIKKRITTREPGQFSKGGRPRSLDTQWKGYHYGFRLDEKENEQFLRLYEKSGAKTKSEFILASIFNRKLRVVKFDRHAYDYYLQLTKMFSQYRAVGNNYNQSVKVINSYPPSQIIIQKLDELYKATKSMYEVAKAIVLLTEDLKNYLGCNNPLR